MEADAVAMEAMEVHAGAMEVATERAIEMATERAIEMATERAHVRQRTACLRSTCSCGAYSYYTFV